MDQNRGHNLRQFVSGLKARQLFVRATLMLIMAIGVFASAEEKFQPANLAFRHVLPDQLESIGLVTSIVQDRQGFIWIGGINGLARYDGYALTIFRHEPGKPGSLSHSYINQILITRDGSMWVATRRGLNLFDRDTETFRVFMHQAESPYGLSVNDARQIFEDSEGRLWLGTRGGLNLFYRETGEFTRYYYASYPEDAGDSTINAIAEDAGGLLWLGNQTGGLTSFDPRQNQFRHFRHQPDQTNSLSHNDVRALFVDSNNRLWIGTYGGGLNVLSDDRQTFQRYPVNQPDRDGTVWAISQDRSGRIWVGHGNGLYVIGKDGSKQEFVYQENRQVGLGNPVVRTLFEDRAGELWLGFFPSGVDILDRQASVFHNYLSSSQDATTISGGGILGVMEDVQGRLWVGAGGGLSRFDVQRRNITNFRHQPANPDSLSGDTVLSLAQDRDNSIWLGIWSHGLNRYDPETGVFSRYPADKPGEGRLIGKEPWGMVVDQEGTLWVATEKGLNRFNRDSDDFTYFVPTSAQMDGDAALSSRAVFEDSHGQLWIGTVRGLYLFNRDTGDFQRYRHVVGDPSTLSNDYVKAIFEDSKGNLWLGTHGGGLNRMDTASGRFEHYTRRDGLPDDVITGITEDGEGLLWLATHNGLVRFDPDNQAVRVLDQHHGLPGNLYNRNALIRTERGELVVGSSKGLTIFDPGELRFSQYIPPVTMTDFKIFNQAVDISPQSPLPKAVSQVDLIELNHSQSVFSLGYAALNYRAPEETRYAYRLEGFDQDWQYVGDRRMATYTNLDPGSYLFRVKASNSEGVWNEEGVRVRVVVKPPIWRTWWAWLLYAVVLVLIALLVLQAFIRRQAFEREHMLNQRLRDLDKLKDEFLANTSHELRTPLNGIIGLSQSLLDGVAGPVPPAMVKHLELIAFSGQRLANLVNDILDFSKLKTHGLELNKKPMDVQAFVEFMLNMTRPLATGKPLELINAVPDNLPPVPADEKRMQQVMYNLLGNAIKFTEHGSVTVSASLESDRVAIDVIDTGIGIPRSYVQKIFESFEQVDGTTHRQHGGTGLGLAITKRLIELHGGSLTVCSTLGVGSRFRVHLPLQRATAAPGLPAPMVKEPA